MSSILLFTKHMLRSNLMSAGLKANKTLLKSHTFGIRYLFTDEILGINGYLETKNRINTQFGQLREKFFARMEEFTTNESKMIFTEDLKNIVFLTQNSEKELDLLGGAIKKFHNQNQSLQFGTFVFGPIVLRLLHHLSEWQLALKLFKDPELKGFFGQIKSAVILMNLLFINGKYEECREVFRLIQNEMHFESKYPRDCLLLYIASAYKINSQESFDEALDVLKKAREAGAAVSRKTVCLFAALALNQNQPNIALEVLSMITQTNYITVKNLRLMALSDLKRFDDLFITLKLIINRDVPQNRTTREEIMDETLQRIKSQISELDDNKLVTELAQIERGLIDGNLITSTPLSDLLLTPVVLRTDITPRDRQLFERQRGFRNPSIQQDYRRRTSNRANEEF
ncbi:unnamed protein product [Oppiella nova]|uniref:Pentatricopeptide repeat-containing protein n=1 Tax=Oppiella nova TaxID=334625 RepID=A0A7R9QPD2_9ACAR|nr:unnamed protein product [Oppiella nova]CAG2170684.1 unnamed protein product [Oppiella nova]